MAHDIGPVRITEFIDKIVQFFLGAVIGQISEERIRPDKMLLPVNIDNILHLGGRQHGKEQDS